jgi:hypothetical protein
MTAAIQDFTAAATAKVHQSVSGAAPTPSASAKATNGSISGLSIAANAILLIAVTR